MLKHVEAGVPSNHRGTVPRRSARSLALTLNGE
jgi:hypothetical protein